MKKTVIELFAGVGGFRVGLNDIKNFDKNGKAIENRDWDFVWANQWEPATKTQHAFDCYVKRFGAAHASNKDISTVNKFQDIPKHTLLVGGFPCQDYSVARTLSGEKGIEGKKGVLFWQIAEILGAKMTPFVLLENVDRLLKSPSKQRGRDFGIMLRTFSDLGYNIEWRIVNAAEYGAAQRRRRVFIFGWKQNTKHNNEITQYTPQQILEKEGLFASQFPIKTFENPEKEIHNIDLLKYEDTVEMTDHFKAEFANSGVMLNGTVYTAKSTSVKEPAITIRQIRESEKDLSKYILTSAQEEKFQFLRGSKKIERIRPNGEIYYYSEGAMAYPDNLDLPGRTMLTSEKSINRSTHVIEDELTGKNRFLTPIEAERLQSFPDDWTNTGMPENRRYFMMGNALVTKMINRLENKLSEIIENED